MLWLISVLVYVYIYVCVCLFIEKKIYAGVSDNMNKCVCACLRCHVCFISTWITETISIALLLSKVIIVSGL